jgi:hypothetical protein
MQDESKFRELDADAQCVTEKKRETTGIMTSGKYNQHVPGAQSRRLVRYFADKRA